MEYYEQIKETTSNEVVLIETKSNILFDNNLGFDPSLEFVPYSEF